MRDKRVAVAGAIVAAIILTAIPAALAAQHATRTPAVCVRAQLSVRNNGTNGAAGTIHGAWVFTNRSTTSCTLNGYPDIQLYDRGGRPITTTVRRDLLPTPSLVTLAAGGSATFFSRYSDVSSGSNCRTSSVIQITPPAAAASLFIPAALQACNGVVHVSAVKAGIHHA